MMIYSKNTISNFSKKKRKKFSEHEIFFNTFSLLNQASFSYNLNYYSYKRRLNFVFFTKLRNFCIFSGHSRTVNAKLKITRHVFSRNVLKGVMPGFFKSVW